MNGRRNLLFIVAAVLLLAFLKFGLSAEEEKGGQTTAITSDKAVAPETISFAAPGDKMPDFAFTGATGEINNQEFLGKPYVVEFIATTCPYCQASAPAFREVFSQSDVNLVVLSATAEPLDLMEEWKRERLAGTDALVATDPGDAVAALSVQGTPTTVFVDSKGVIASIYPGSITEEELRSLVARISS